MCEETRTNAADTAPTNSAAKTATVPSPANDNMPISMFDKIGDMAGAWERGAADVLGIEL